MKDARTGRQDKVERDQSRPKEEEAKPKIRMPWTQFQLQSWLLGLGVQGSFSLSVARWDPPEFDLVFEISLNKKDSPSTIRRESVNSRPTER